MRQMLARALLIIVTLFVVVLYYVPIGHVDFAESWGEGTFGIALPPQQLVVTTVERGSVADRAGVSAGDRLLINGNYEVPARIRSAYPGERETLRFERGGVARTVTLTAVPNRNFSILSRIGGVLAYLPPTVFLVVAFLLVFLRPSIMSWAFYLFAVGYFGTGPAFMYWSHVLSPTAYWVLSFVLSTVFGAWSVLPLLPLCCVFPTGTCSGGVAESILSCGRFSRCRTRFMSSSGGRFSLRNRFRVGTSFQAPLFLSAPFCSPD